MPPPRYVVASADATLCYATAASHMSPLITLAAIILLPCRHAAGLRQRRCRRADITLIRF